MSTLTKNLKLAKPALSDNADITAYNSNWDKIDARLTVVGLINGVDYTFDTALEQGEYNVQATDVAGTPYTGTLYGKLIVTLNDGKTKTDSNWIWQEFLPAVSSKQKCWRMKINTGDWTDWFVYYDSGHKPSLDELGAAANNHKHQYTIQIGYDREDIASYADLNDILDMGCYRCTTATKSANLKNCPTQNAFILDVVAATGGNIKVDPNSYAYAAQRIYDLDGKQYVRQITSNASGTIIYDDWIQIYSTLNKPSPSDIGAEPAVESDTSGCYYRDVNGVREWINPPMAVGIEYATTERFNGKAVYVKLINCGTLPNATSKNVNHGITGTIISFNAWASNSSKNKQTFPIISSTSGQVSCKLHLTDGTILITAFDDMSSYTAECTIKYVKD